MSGPREQVGRVSTLELFFDLVFVFTITQLTAVLNDDPTTRGIGRGYSRGVAALLALATIPLGVAVSALAQLAVVVVLLGGALVAEHAMTRTGPPGTALPRDHP